MDWILDELANAGGEATILHLAMEVWAKHEREIRASGKLLYTWQYDMRWAAHELRKRGKLAPATSTQRGRWALK